MAGKVVLVTGASSGIGAGTALAFAKKGYSVVLNGRNKTDLNKIARQCSEEGNLTYSKVLIAPGDVTKEDDVKSVINKTISTFKKLDILINNAGILTLDNFEDCNLENYDRSMNTNLKSVVMVTKYALPYLVQTKGCIVNVSSISGIRPMPGCLFYACSKAALDQFTKIIAVELAPKGVRVNSVNPGVIKTNVHFRAGYTKEGYQNYLKMQKQVVPLGRYGNVDDVSKVITFLASDEASYITGAIVPIDGGRINVTPRTAKL